ncbi:MAG TPA: DUF3276 family protein [Rhodothermales bacterium]|nr:DUF3276 family protein [Rhodothermales bacterium]
MSYDQRDRNRHSDVHEEDSHGEAGTRGGSYRDEVYSKRVPAGKRTYFFDVKSTRSGDDFFVTITESKRIDEGHYEKHKIFLYKEDFAKFINAMHEVVQHIQKECLPDYDFRNLPELTVLPDEEVSNNGAYDDGDRGY